MLRPMTYFLPSFSRPSFTDEESSCEAFGRRFCESKSSEHYGFFLGLNFTGKETDCETGYSYFGARYYDPSLLTSWTAVDPMSDDYPNMTPYHYCHWNPIRLTDPTGMSDEGWQLELTTGVWTRTDSRGAGFQNFYTFTNNGTIVGTGMGFGCNPNDKTEFSNITTNLTSTSFETFSMHQASVDYSVKIDNITYWGNASQTKTIQNWNVNNWSDGFKITSDIAAGGLLMASNAFNPEIGNGSYNKIDPGYKGMNITSNCLTFASSCVSVSVGYCTFRTGYTDGDWGKMIRGSVEMLSGFSGFASILSPAGPWKIGFTLLSNGLATADLMLGGMIDEKW